MAKKKVEETINLDSILFKCRDILRKARNSGSFFEKRDMMLTLVFLRFIGEKFDDGIEVLRQKLIEMGLDPDDEEIRAAFFDDATFTDGTYNLPVEARWSNIINTPAPQLNVALDTALHSIAASSSQLKGCFIEGTFTTRNLAPNDIKQLVDEVNKITHKAFGVEKDLIGRVYEYFLKEFAVNATKEEGEFYTPHDVVQLIATMIEPFDGTLYDPCCGSGGMFVQSAELVKAKRGDISRINIYGQEKDGATYRLAKMNLALRGISHNLGETYDSSFTHDLHKGLYFNYIMANPPFVGARLMSETQKSDVNRIFAGWNSIGNLDYACCWYKKAADLMKGTAVRAALVSTNSVTQGESVALLWKPLFEEGVHIDFAHRTFRWDSEASSKAHVHCVIVGFSIAPNSAPRRIFIDNRPQIASNINGYLIDMDNIFIESRNKPLCDVPEIGIGNKPIDGGNYLFTEEEMREFIAKEPASSKWFKPWYGSQEFINQKPRYCLWLGECPPNVLRKMPECMKRVEAVRNFRLASKSAGTVKLADRPTRFHVENMPKGTYVVIPEVSSEKRRYVPIGYMESTVLCSNKLRLMPDAGLYHFGVLTSNVHMSWMRTVCGRLKSDYSYSVNIVYNNFPWPTPTPAQKARIEQTAQAILDARALYPDCSLADLYNRTTMPPELNNAHQDNDRAVMTAYGIPVNGTNEASCAAWLMRLYQKLTQK